MSSLRIIYICASYWMGSNDEVRIMHLSLEDLGARVLELNLGRYPHLVYAPEQSAYPKIPKQVILKELKPFLDSFKPDIIVCVAGGITFFEHEYKELMDKYITVGITVSDPEAYYWHGRDNIYAHRFKYFFTNSIEAQRLYKQEHGIDTYIFQQGCYPGFHKPMKVKKEFDVVVVGHGKPDRVEAVNALAKYFKVGIWGHNWEGCVLKPLPEVHGKDYIKAINSGKLYVSFARTESNRLAVKYHIFEATACKIPVFCEEFDEMKDYFDYGKEEIIGYTSLDDLCKKIGYYIGNYREAEEIAYNGYRRSIAEHTWHQRWIGMFNFISYLEGKRWKLVKGWRYYYHKLKFGSGFYDKE